MNELFLKAATALNVSPGGLMAMIFIVVVGIVVYVMLQNMMKGVLRRADQMAECARDHNLNRLRRLNGEPEDPFDKHYDA